LGFNKTYIKLVERFLPSPFIIAILLSGITFLLALIFTGESNNILVESKNILGYWQTGFWELLAFTMQMVLILLLGHTLALTPFFSKIIAQIAEKAKNTAQAAFLISFSTILVSFVNWGLCVVFGAILCRKIAESFTQSGKAINYGLLGAAGYSGMMAWHGGLSGSAPLKVAESNHFLVEQTGIIPISDTIFSLMNISISLTLLLVIPALFYVLGIYFQPNYKYEKLLSKTTSPPVDTEISNTLDSKKWPALVLGGLMLLSALLFGWGNLEENKSFIDLNYIIFLLLAFGILLHGSLNNFMLAINSGIKGVSGIIVQFPLYSGIMGIMKYSGLVLLISDFFVSISTAQSFPILTFFSGGLVNFFVPSGGGQWAVQGPIVVEAAKELNIPLPKIVMALAYGDQITNMIQPFWALPLLGITRLKAKDILPYSTIILLAGTLIFVTGLLIIG